MEAIELRYISDFEGKEIIQMVHTTFEHTLGEQVITTISGKGVKMTVIAREDNITSIGHKLVCKLYNNYKGTIPTRIVNRFEHKVRLALRIMNTIGKLDEMDQEQAYQAYCDKLMAQRNARLVSAIKGIERILGTL